MSNQENNQKQIQFPAQQELKHLRTRCGKVYALGNNRFRAVVQTTPVHEYDAATHQWVELSAEKRQRMAAQAHSPIATFADSANSAENAAGILDTYVKEGSTQNFSHDERLWISNTNYYGNRLTYLKVVDLPRLGANHFITSAKLCVRNVYAPSADTAIMCKEVLKDWHLAEPGCGTNARPVRIPSVPHGVFGRTSSPCPGLSWCPARRTGLLWGSASHPAGVGAPNTGTATKGSAQILW